MSIYDETRSTEEIMKEKREKGLCYQYRCERKAHPPFWPSKGYSRHCLYHYFKIGSVQMRHIELSKKEW